MEKESIISKSRSSIDKVEAKIDRQVSEIIKKTKTTKGEIERVAVN